MADVEQIIAMIRGGLSRAEVAEQFGVQVSSLNQTMRRSGYRWDNITRNFEPDSVLPGEHIVDGQALPSRIVHVITAFRKVTSDPKEVARLANYKDEREMAEDMRSHGLVWSSAKRNYIPKLGNVSDWHAQTPSIVRQEIRGDTDTPIRVPVPKTVEIPRYNPKSMRVPTSVSVAQNLRQLMKKVSKESHLRQNEIVEVALIEFFFKYGYEDEIRSLLS